jgi:hypothetical protein
VAELHALADRLHIQTPQVDSDGVAEIIGLSSQYREYTADSLGG